MDLDLRDLSPGNYFIDLQNDQMNQKFKIVITK